MSLHEHVDSLRAKHARLERQLDDELHRPLPDQAAISKLKKEKLRVKDELEQLHTGHMTPHDALTSAAIN